MKKLSHPNDIPTINVTIAATMLDCVCKQLRKAARKRTTSEMRRFLINTAHVNAKFALKQLDPTRYLYDKLNV